MKRHIAAVLASGAFAFAMTNAYADISAAVGAEEFHWHEYASPAIKETGLRWAGEITWTQSREPGWSFGYQLKGYVGNVDYEGATFFTNTPVNGTTHYRGMINEARLFYRLPNNPFNFMGALGWDTWDRELTSVQSEQWDIAYLRLGAEYNAAVKQGAIGSLGVKFPLVTRVNAHLQDSPFSLPNNPRIKPGRFPSLYATIGARIDPRWDLIVYYDSYWLKQSGTVDAGNGVGVFQPKTHMDVYGVKLQFTFL